MTEASLLTPPHETMQGPEAASEMLDVLNQLTSPEALAARKQWLEDSVAGEHDVSMVHVRRLQDEKDRQINLANTALEQLDFKQRDAHTAAYKSASATLDRVYGKTKHELNTLENDLDSINRDGPQYVRGAEAEKIADQIINATQVIDDGIDRELVPAPVTNPNAPLTDFANYLSQKRFIDFKTLQAAKDTTKSQLVLSIQADQLRLIPMQNVVSANGFEADSWVSTSAKSYVRADGVKVESTSIKVIKDYAQRQTPLPPTEGITAFVQPNGIVLYGAVTSNHRTAAAIARGDEWLQVAGSMEVMMLGKNFVEAPADNS